MIPRNLPSLVSDALRTGWDVHVHHRYGPSVAARFQRGDERVDLEWWWKNGGLVLSVAEVNTYPTPYAACARLIRSPEGAPE